jgi:hypothetical protein
MSDRYPDVLAWFQFAVSDVSQTVRTFSGHVRTFAHELQLLPVTAFKKTISEKGKIVPILDEDSCQIGQITFLSRPVEGALCVRGKIWPGVDREFVEMLHEARQIALRLEILKQQPDGTVTEVRLKAAMLQKYASRLTPQRASEHNVVSVGVRTESTSHPYGDRSCTPATPGHLPSDANRVHPNYDGQVRQ